MLKKWKIPLDADESERDESNDEDKFEKDFGDDSVDTDLHIESDSDEEN